MHVLTEDQLVSLTCRCIFSTKHDSASLTSFVKPRIRQNDQRLTHKRYSKHLAYYNYL